MCAFCLKKPTFLAKKLTRRVLNIPCSVKQFKQYIFSIYSVSIVKHGASSISDGVLLPFFPPDVGVTSPLKPVL